MEVEPLDSAEAIREISVRSIALDHSYAATIPDSPLHTDTLDAACQTSTEPTGMQMTNATEDSFPQCHSNKAELEQLSLEMQQLKERMLALQSKSISLLPRYAVFVSNDKQVRLNTGLPNKAALNSLFTLLKERAERMRYWLGNKRTPKVRHPRNYRQSPSKPGPKRILSCKEEFILTLMKLRLAMTTQFLSKLFGISLGTCSSILNKWLTFLARELQCLVFWPDQNQIRSFMPKSLRLKYPSLRCIIDCSETFIERPRDLKLQACTWSDYKKHNTLKYLIAVTPDGMIIRCYIQYGAFQYVVNTGMSRNQAAGH